MELDSREEVKDDGKEVPLLKKMVAKKKRNPANLINPSSSTEAKALHEYIKQQVRAGT